MSAVGERTPRGPRSVEGLRSDLGLVPLGPRLLSHTVLLSALVEYRGELERRGGRVLTPPTHYSHRAVSSEFRSVRASPVVHFEFEDRTGTHLAAHGRIEYAEVRVTTTVLDPTPAHLLTGPSAPGASALALRSLHAARAGLPPAGLAALRDLRRVRGHDLDRVLPSSPPERVRSLLRAAVFEVADEGAYRDAVALVTALASGAPLGWALRHLDAAVAS